MKDIMKKFKSLGFTVFVFMIFILFYFSFKTFFTKEYFLQNYQYFKYYVDNYYLSSVLVFMLAMIITAGFLIPVTGLITMAGGALFGIVKGGIYSTIAFSLGTAISLFFVRYFFADSAAQKLKKYENKIPKFKSDNWFWIVCSLYISTFTPTFVVIFLASLSPIKILTYVFASLIGAFPGALMYSFLGNKLIQVQTAELPWYTYLILIILSAVFLVPIFLGGKKNGQKQ
jgi:uncharacterized membrane protein YdjX (TVP38/TMEM64 family)